MKKQFIIKDWHGNLIKFKKRPYIFDSFDDAEDVLCEELDENYDNERQEYEIVSIEGF